MYNAYFITFFRLLKSYFHSPQITLGGKGHGRLTDKTIKKLTLYYSRAVRKSKTVMDMRKSILASMYHGFATDATPQRHNLCPKHEGSWCFYQDAVARGVKPGPHKKMVKTPLDHDTLAKHLKPLYKRMTDPKLLKRCLLHATQNANENLHGKIWRICSKNCFHGRDRVQFLVTHAVNEFNFGASANTDLKTELAIPESVLSKQLGLWRMNKRIDQSIKRRIKSVQERLKQKKEAKEKRAEEASYGPGICGSS